MYNSKVKNLELPENLFSNLGEIKSKKSEEKSTPELDIDEMLEEIEKSIPNYEFLPNVKLTNYSNKKEYRDRIDKMYEDIKGIKPIDGEIDNILYFSIYCSSGYYLEDFSVWRSGWRMAITCMYDYVYGWITTILLWDYGNVFI